jgi:hypothetical protein
VYFLKAINIIPPSSKSSFNTCPATSDCKIERKKERKKEKVRSSTEEGCIVTEIFKDHLNRK